VAVSLWVVDAFTSVAFRGNPAAVVLLDETGVRDVDWMRAVAAEMRHSETAFVVRRDDGAFDLRWFTPEVEVDLCGHATLASAHVLFSRSIASSPVAFHTRSGELRAAATDSGIELDFPATPGVPCPAPDGLVDALGVEPVATERAAFYMLAELGDAASVRDLDVDFDRLSAIDTRAVIVTAAGDDPDHDIVCRVFGPNVGIPEDPVTGSAQCMLAPYWVPRLGKDRYVAHQASARGGELRVHLDGERVRIAGNAVTVLEGSLLA
jgi:predicted PhzF superfamily epimerase YddE/YHI9